MSIVAVGVPLLWAAWAAWAGSSMTLKAVTLRRRIGGAVLMSIEVVGLIHGVRLFAS